MAIRSSEIAQALIGAKQSVSISLMTPSETLLGSPTAVPTAEPGTSQIIYTVQSSDLPAMPVGATATAIGSILGAVLNSSGAANAIYYRMIKNGSSVYSYWIPFANATYETLMLYFNGIVAGDMLELRLWTSGITGFTWDYKAYCVFPSRPHLTPDKRVLTDFTSTLTAYPVLSSGTPSIAATYAPLVYNANFAPPNGGAQMDPLTVDFIIPYPTYGLVRAWNGDYTGSDSVTGRNHATARPYYVQNKILTACSFRQTALRG